MVLFIKLKQFSITRWKLKLDYSIICYANSRVSKSLLFYN